MFGPHLIFDGSGCNIESLNCLNTIFDFLDRLPGRVGMVKITQPYVFNYSGNVPEDYGVTGIVVISTSHASLHTFPGRDGFLTFDLYSCKEFDPESVIDFIQEVFEPESYQYRVLERGEDFKR